MENDGIKVYAAGKHGDNGIGIFKKSALRDLDLQKIFRDPIAVGNAADLFRGSSNTESLDPLAMTVAISILLSSPPDRLAFTSRLI